MLVKAPVAHPMVVFVPAGGAEPPVGLFSQEPEEEGLPHASHCTPLVIMGSLSGHARGCSAQGHFNNGQI